MNGKAGPLLTALTTATLVAGCTAPQTPAGLPLNRDLSFPITLGVGEYTTTAAGCTGAGFWRRLQQRQPLQLVDEHSRPVEIVRLSTGVLDPARHECVMHFEATLPSGVRELWFASGYPNAKRHGLVVSRTNVFADGQTITVAVAPCRPSALRSPCPS